MSVRLDYDSDLCKICKKARLITDYNNGEILCSNCGVVQVERTEEIELSSMDVIVIKTSPDIRSVYEQYKQNEAYEQHKQGYAILPATVLPPTHVEKSISNLTETPIISIRAKKTIFQRMQRTIKTGKLRKQSLQRIFKSVKEINDYDSHDRILNMLELNLQTKKIKRLSHKQLVSINRKSSINTVGDAPVRKSSYSISITLVKQDLDIIIVLSRLIEQTIRKKDALIKKLISRVKKSKYGHEYKDKLSQTFLELLL